MITRVFFGASSLFCALLPLSAFAQKTNATTQLLPERTIAKTVASSIDTNNIFVQIDETYNYQPRWPENPVNRIDPPLVSNNLRAGGMFTQQAGTLGGLFPAIGATGWTPADPDIAVGPNHILATVNSSIAWFDKTGTKLFQQTAQTFFAGMGAGSFQFDPKCFYDRVNQRYVMVFLEQSGSPQTSKLLVAISDDNNPAGTWHRYRLEAMLNIGGQNFWLDYPGFGYNKDAYVVTGNMFGFSNGFGGVQFVVIPKTPLLTGAPVTTTSFRHAGGASAQVAEMISNSVPNIYAVSRNGGSAVTLYSVNTPGGTPTINFTSVTVPPNSGPGMDAQSTSGNFLDSIDGRVFNATWRDGKLVTAHNIQSGSFLGSRWYQLNTNGYPSSAPTLGQSGNLTSASQHFFCPAISVNAYGDISAGFTGSSTSITANLLFSGRTVIDAAGTMGAAQLLESSSGNNYNQGRWGDYFGVDVDPVDDMSFWGIGMTVAANNSWRTSIFKWRIAPLLKSLTVTPNPVSAGGTATVTVTLTSPAGPGGVKVALTTSPRGSFPELVSGETIPEGAVSTSTVIQTSAAQAGRQVAIKAALGRATREVVLAINP
jgi:hypothetical protein